MAFWCCVLNCSDGKYYTGHTDDPERRVAEHRHGAYGALTSRRLPVTLFGAQDFPSRYEALQGELTVRKRSCAKKDARARSVWQALSHFAKPPTERSTGDPPIGVSTPLDTNRAGEH